MVQIKRQLLQNIAIFGALSQNALDFLLARAEEIDCPHGDYVFREGDKARSIYVLESGRVAILKTWQSKQFLLGHLEAGACFGEMALMDMHPRSASVLAVEDLQAFKVGAAAILELYQLDLEQFTLLQMNLGREVSRRLREADERMFRWQVGSQGPANLPVFPKLASPALQQEH